MNKIYFDHSASTPVDKKVLEAMLPYFVGNFGNPSSLHSFGQEAVEGVDRAREQVAKYLNCSPHEIIFTSGATESDNLAIRGIIKAARQKGQKSIHVITSKVEHDAVLEPCADMEKEGVEVTYVGVGKDCRVRVNDIVKAIKDETVLVSIMWVNAEVGSIMPIREIGKAIKKINDKRLKEWNQKRPAERGGKPRLIYFHTDATQAVNFIRCDVTWNYIDMLSLSGHKIYGPKGVGALYKKAGVPLAAIQLGGHHENNLRSGTLNVPGIVGLGAAIELLNPAKVEKDNKKIAVLRDALVKGVLEKISNVVLNTPLENATPAHAHFSFVGIEGESILMMLDLKGGIAVSTGSACASGSLEPSHVLLAMGIKKEVAHSSIRFSLGKHNTMAEIKKAIKLLPPIVERLRQMAPEL